MMITAIQSSLSHEFHMHDDALKCEKETYVISQAEGNVDHKNNDDRFGYQKWSLSRVYGQNPKKPCIQGGERRLLSPSR